MDAGQVLTKLDCSRTRLNKVLEETRSKPSSTLRQRLRVLASIIEVLTWADGESDEPLAMLADSDAPSYTELLWAAEVYEAMQNAAEHVLDLAADIINELEGPKNGTHLRARSKLKRIPVHPVEAAAPWDPLEGDFPSYEGGCSCETCTGPIDDEAADDDVDDDPVGALTDGHDDAPDMARAAGE